MYQKRPSAAARRSRSSGSACSPSQSSAPRRSSCAPSSRSSQTPCSGPLSSGSARSAQPAKYAACRPCPSASADGSSSPYSRTTSSSPYLEPKRRTTLAATSASSAAPASSSPPTALAASSVNLFRKIATRPKRCCAAGSSSSKLQSIAARIVRWRSGASRAPSGSTSRRESRSRTSSAGGRERNHGAASSIASGIPSSRSHTSPKTARFRVDLDPRGGGSARKQLACGAASRADARRRRARPKAEERSCS